MKKERLVARIEKAAGKKKSAVIIDAMDIADQEVTVRCLELLAEIADEDSCNHIAHMLDAPDDDVRVAACKAAIKINTEYMNTRVRYQMSIEQNPAVKKAVQEAFNQSNN